MFVWNASDLAVTVSASIRLRTARTMPTSFLLMKHNDARLAEEVVPFYLRPMSARVQRGKHVEHQKFDARFSAPKTEIWTRHDPAIDFDRR